MQKKFYASFVLFNPENNLFVESIKVLIALDIRVLIFDNSTIEDSIIKNKELIQKEFDSTVILLKSDQGNVGLGIAFNKIVKMVITENNCRGIFFFDQDSEVNREAIMSLLSSFNTLGEKKIGIIGGLAMRKQGMPYRIRRRSRSETLDSNLIVVNQVPSSFSLIPISTFEKVGLFYEDFFIDHIDMDFSMRCWDNNLPVYIDKNATFKHEVGIGDVVIFKKYLFPYGSAYRHYYQIRNHILSLKRNGKSFFLIIKEILSRTIIVLIISIFVGDFVERFKYLFKGIYDGLRGITGKLIIKNPN